MQQPRLKASFTVEILDGDTDEAKVFLVADDQHYLVRGRAAVAVLPYLDGRHTVAEIVTELQDRFSPTQVFTAVRRFEAAGHLVEGRADLPEAELGFWDGQGVDPIAVEQARTDRTVRVRTGEGVDPAPVLDALRAAGVQVSDAADADLTVVLVDDYLDPMLAEINSEHLASGRPWLLAKPTGRTVWLGPAFTPGRTGCWSCLAQRLGENRQLERYLSSKRGARVPLSADRDAIVAGPAVLAGLLAVEALRAVATGTPTALDATMTTLDLQSLQTQQHHLVRRPQCPDCGDAALTAQRSPKIVLAPRRAEHTTDGGFRIRSPHATFDRLQHHISPYLGAITRLGAHDDMSNGITFSYTAGHNFAMVNDNMDLLRRNMRGQSGGKGRSEIQAKVSALCEAIERYSAVWRDAEPTRRARYDDLDPAVAVHVDDLLRFSPAQYETRADWNQDPRHRMQLVPDPFRTDLDLEWTSAWSLTDDAERLVPAGYAWYGHPDLRKHFYCVSDSNGGASGNTVEEAIVQGFCELVERDAVALWWYNRLRVPGFDLDSLGDPYVDTVREFYASMDRDVWALELTSDLGIPVFAVLSHRFHDVEDVMVGFGAHPDPRIAAMRALTELNQFLPFINQRDADGNTVYRTDDHATLDWCRGARLSEQQWLTPDAGQPVRTLADHALPDTLDLAEQIRELTARARSAGLDVLVVDQTQPDLDLAVVKVIVPGMRHFWRRLGSGRLYDVPVRQGRLARPTEEAAMNPWNVFF